ncbi:hypothetical protein [Geodermatophilus marinus]|uniref:hypothetical protein n=1 Tax=Geodermatophilus sp. LHW52908 TaxID=2303986 RepID=UPI000E3BE933|nr:hypothetical protein [Geodermatophilus sp. LHW52908]RFU20420.1 hypothetical protein D0Z06_16185 [Geodermatophilus sp. LHW52908]
MGWAITTAVGFVLATALVVWLGRGVTARWEVDRRGRGTARTGAGAGPMPGRPGRLRARLRGGLPEAARRLVGPDITGWLARPRGPQRRERRVRIPHLGRPHLRAPHLHVPRLHLPHPSPPRLAMPRLHLPRVADRALHRSGGRTLHVPLLHVLRPHAPRRNRHRDDEGPATEPPS